MFGLSGLSVLSRQEVLTERAQQTGSPQKVFVIRTFSRSDLQQLQRNSHQDGSLQVGGNAPEQQPPHQAGDGREDERPAQSSGHRRVILWTGSVGPRRENSAA